MMCGAAFGAASPAKGTVADDEAAKETVLNVRVFNYAGVSHATLAKGMSEATRILGEAGVRLRWIDCPLRPQEAESNPVCRGGLEPNVVVVRLQPRFSPALSPKFRDATLGFAPLVEGGRGSYANIFQDRVRALARGGDFSEALILGHAVAHEIGHLLLGTMTHSASGLMRAHLGRDELKLAQKGRLLFSREQAKIILEELRVRNAMTLTAAAR
jgi:hypothetical protein